MKSATIHSVWLRLCHWVNVLAMLIMVTSGWRIYNASPLFDAMFPDNLTLGGWLGGAIQWHFAGMWLFGINGVVYLLINIFSGRLKRKFFPLTIQGIFADFKDALRGKLAHADLSKYNMVQKLAYLFVMCDGVLLVVSGLVVWKSVQFPLLNTLMGGFDAARYVHFFAMSAMVGFVVIHLIMVMLVPKTLLTMLRGR
ncbi:cytochrome b/b6 domain-containing protein [Buttiauxella selenatireducens]|uniref:Cytochrome b/b6 domain-containing protein n=1 Tax=Buttiauxella selenatireducens TaxID=3073902 RepID=A0ABY9S6I1_9ENTR|nr:cytochrome b/b6 domain-containing protein [Buttiauxella sp. R73]WMY72969.1 cytochrome b/b6 domain-containing protein [Buttiauxella sp. R73]